MKQSTIVIAGIAIVAIVGVVIYLAAKSSLTAA